MKKVVVLCVFLLLIPLVYSLDPVSGKIYGAVDQLEVEVLIQIDSPYGKQVCIAYPEVTENSFYADLSQAVLKDFPEIKCNYQEGDLIWYEFKHQDQYY